MSWKREESHHVGSYVFHWFADSEGDWLVAIWNEKNAPDQPKITDARRALTLHHVSKRDNPRGKLKPVRDFCMRFVEDVPFRVRAIRNKTPTIHRLESRGVLPSSDE